MKALFSAKLPRTLIGSYGIEVLLLTGLARYEARIVDVSTDASLMYVEISVSVSGNLSVLSSNWRLT